MARNKQQPDPTKNDEFGTAGHETGIEEPSELGSAGLYAPRIHDEGEEALEAGQSKADSPER
jgi:hypothetical protein